MTLAGATANASFIADGSLADWGSNDSWTTDSWITGLTGTGSGFSYVYFKEDTPGNDGHGTTLGPNQGGQDYDAEFIGVGVSGTKLNIVIVTGQRQDNGLAYYSPGDIRITATNGDLFGIEVGGGKGGAGASSVGLGSAGSFFNLNSDGTTKTDGSGVVFDSISHTAGTVWKTLSTDWQVDPINGGTPPLNGQEQVQVQFTKGTLKGAASSYIYAFGSTLGQHAVIELQVDLSVFGGDTLNNMRWAPSCGNDFVYVDLATVTTHNEAPEPATFVMGMLGMVGMAGLRWRRRQAA
ncbi:MAG: PEP-CTERM sorting domain-containing protein [Planctomycetaceae bacterium]